MLAMLFTAVVITTGVVIGLMTVRIVALLLLALIDATLGTK